ncbi:MAG: ATP-binding protein, partial [Planctomycetaceae bacterium]|nr:ATP-binding protein [Planctomycetaceae bacterium]
RYPLPEETVNIECGEIQVRRRLIPLEILFRNLIDNAVKYPRATPEVKIQVQLVADQNVVVSIIDNGPGIPANQRRKIFGRFIRLGNELERSTPGTGLGLYLVRNVVKSLGGSIRLQDREMGTGTEFEVTLGGVVPAEVPNNRETSHAN